MAFTRKDALPERFQYRKIRDIFNKFGEHRITYFN